LPARSQEPIFFFLQFEFSLSSQPSGHFAKQCENFSAEPVRGIPQERLNEKKMSAKLVDENEWQKVKSAIGSEVR
jgi:hypothetical protein